MQQSEIKKRIGEKAAMLVKNGMTIGLGTGTTAAAFIQSLAERNRLESLNITCVATSIESEELALSLGLHCVSIDSVDEIDVTFDGADEVDEKKRLIKGAGGALLREKILANASGKLVVMVDEQKLVKYLGKAKLPVEVTPFGHRFTKANLVALGYTKIELRQNSDGSTFVTDNHNFIYDIQYNQLFKEPEKEDEKIRKIPGVVETGFFFDLAGPVIVGKVDGSVVVI